MFKKIFLFLALISAVGISNHPVWAGTDPGGDTGGAGTEPQSVLDKLIAGISGEDYQMEECDMYGENCIVTPSQPIPAPAPAPVPEPEPPTCDPEDDPDAEPSESHTASDGSYVKKAEISLAQLYKFLHSAPGASYSLNGLIMTVNKATLTNQCTTEVTMDAMITHENGHVTRGSLKMNRNGARLEPIPVRTLKPKK